ncbi:hypothetical protein GGH14_000682 [Coemansia sp. RSA 370]|nr:hypothetical protein GGH14_000682 [Coemansia sp. RSA 370]
MACLYPIRNGEMHIGNTTVYTGPISHHGAIPGGFAMALSSVSFAYLGTTIVPHIEGGMRRPEKFSFIFGSALAVIAAIYVVMAATGYWAYGDQTLSPITQNFPKLWPTTLANISMTIHVLLAGPLYLVQMSLEIEGGLGISQKKPRIERLWRLGIRIASALVILAVSEAIPFFDDVISLVGALTNPVLIYLAPISISEIVPSAVEYATDETIEESESSVKGYSTVTSDESTEVPATGETTTEETTTEEPTTEKSASLSGYGAVSDTSEVTYASSGSIDSSSAAPEHGASAATVSTGSVSPEPTSSATLKYSTSDAPELETSVTGAPAPSTPVAPVYSTPAAPTPSTTAAPALNTTAVPKPFSEENTSEPFLIQYTTITVHSSETDSSVSKPAPTASPSPSNAFSATQSTAIPAAAPGPAAAPAAPSAGSPAAPGYTTAGHARKNTKARVAPKRIRRRIRHIIRNRGLEAKKVHTAKPKETIH